MATLEQQAFLRELEQEKEEPARRAAARRSRLVRPIARVAGGSGASANFPNATNTGPAAGTVFTVTTGDFITTSNGQIIANRQINNGQIDIRHSGVIVRDCIVNSQD